MSGSDKSAGAPAATKSGSNSRSGSTTGKNSEAGAQASKAKASGPMSHPIAPSPSAPAGGKPTFSYAAAAGRALGNGAAAAAPAKDTTKDAPAEKAPSATGVTFPNNMSTGDAKQAVSQFMGPPNPELVNDTDAPSAAAKAPAAAAKTGPPAAGKPAPVAPQAQGPRPPYAGAAAGPRGPRPPMPYAVGAPGGINSAPYNPGAMFYPAQGYMPYQGAYPMATGAWGGNQGGQPPVPASGMQYGSNTGSVNYSAATTAAPAAPKTNIVQQLQAQRKTRTLKITDPTTGESLDLSSFRKDTAATTPKAGASEAPPTPSRDNADAAEEKKEAPVETKTNDVKVEKPEAETKKEEPKSSFAEAAVKPPSRPASGADDRTPAVISPFSSVEFQNGPDANGVLRYSTDFLFSIKERCVTPPEHMEPETWNALSIDEADKARGFAPPERVDDRNWKSGRMPSGPPGMGGPPGMRGGRQGSGRRGSGIEADQWERGKPLPPMAGGFGRGGPPGVRGSSGALPALHKTDSAYKAGRITTDDPEEERAQKSLKAMLNKITPQNFEKMTLQIIDKINERKKAVTLQGFIDQIFDKALTETTFAELYAELVARLSPALPELADEEGNPIEFRRTLINKCQEEFDNGVLAMIAVAEREKREKDHPQEEEPEVEKSEETEEGEITDEQKVTREAEAAAKRQEKEQADAEVKARKRMLGNIIFVGQLYRMGVLTETVMHSCIKQLLEETENPRHEDIECLCKLLTTVGRPMDQSERMIKSGNQDEEGNFIKVSTKDMMQVYFNRIANLSKNEALDSRHRFMLQDLIDLRMNSWTLRRKAEGPKRIEDIHRDAAMERSRSQMLDRQQSGRGGRDLPRGSTRPPFDNRVDGPIRTINRPVANQDAGQGQSLRPGGRPAPAARPSQPSAAPPPPPERKESEPASSQNGLSEELAGRAKSLVMDYYNDKDLNEAMICIKELIDAGVDMPAAVDTMFTVSLESKGTEWPMLSELLDTFSQEDLLSNADLEQGLRQLLNKLDDTAVDVPKAPEQVGEVIGNLVASKRLGLKEIGQHILEAELEAGETPEGEDTMFVSGGGASKLIASLLRALSAKAGDEAKPMWQESGLSLAAFLPAEDRESAELLDKLATETGVPDILA